MSEARPKPKQAKQPKRPPPVEASAPIIGGRVWIAVAMLLGLGLIANPRFNQEISNRYAPKEPYTNVREWKLGKEADVRVTVITADAQRLACSHDTEAEGVHCAYRSDGRPWPKSTEVLDDNNATIVQPYRTSPDNQLILISGIWATPPLAMRVHQEPAAGVAVKKLQRFEARCRVKFLTNVEKVKLRWEPTQKWYTEPRAMMAKALRCTIAGTE